MPSERGPMNFMLARCGLPVITKPIDLSHLLRVLAMRRFGAPGSSLLPNPEHRGGGPRVDKDSPSAIGAARSVCPSIPELQGLPAATGITPHREWRRSPASRGAGEEAAWSSPRPGAPVRERCPSGCRSPRELGESFRSLLWTISHPSSPKPLRTSLTASRTLLHREVPHRPRGVGGGEVDRQVR